MSRTRRDAAVTALAALAILVYLANAGGWSVPLLDQNRWAVGALALLGVAMCATGARVGGPWTSPMIVLGAVGFVAFALIVVGLVTASQAALTSLLVVLLVLWTGATIRHSGAHVAGRRTRSA